MAAIALPPGSAARRRDRAAPAAVVVRLEWAHIVGAEPACPPAGHSIGGATMVAVRLPWSASSSPGCAMGGLGAGRFWPARHVYAALPGLGLLAIRLWPISA
jgi:hypothetical protein